MATIDQFKAQLIGGGARANQFRVILNTPPGIATGLPLGTSSFFIKAASLPGQTIPEITVNFRGRQLFLAGDRTFEPWSVTVVNDGQFGIRKAFETWSRGINALTENVSHLYRTSIQHLCNCCRTPTENVSSVYRTSIEHLEIISWKSKSAEVY